MRGTIILFDFVFTTMIQAPGAPIVDRCSGHTPEGRWFNGYAIHLSPWRKNEYGDRQPGLAFCVGRMRRKVVWHG
jgi:hypothetical protein